MEGVRSLVWGDLKVCGRVSEEEAEKISGVKGKSHRALSILLWTLDFIL